MYKILRIIAFSLLCFYIPGWVIGQNAIKGIVRDAASGAPLKNAEIEIAAEIYVSEKQTKQDTLNGNSDKNGYFEVKITHTASGSIYFKHKGYETIEYPFERANDVPYLNVYMYPTNSSLGAVVVNASHTETPLLKAPGSVAVITKNDLERDDQVMITPALNRVPGLFMHSGTYSTNRITIRGIGTRSPYSTNKVRAYYNDIPLTTGEGQTTLEDIDLTTIGRVEVIKGPASSIYGAGLGGTINIKPKRAEYNKRSVSFGTTLGSFGLQKYTGNVASGDDNLNINLTLNNLHTDGYRENSQYDRNSITAFGHYYSGGKTDYTLLANIIQLKAFIPSSIDSTTFYNTPWKAAQSWKNTQGYEEYTKSLFGAGFRHQFNQKLVNNTSVFLSFRDNYEPRPFNILSEASHSYGARSKFTLNLNVLNNPAKIIAGGEIFNEWYEWKTFENNNRFEGDVSEHNEENRTYYNVFGQLDINFSEKTLLTAGLNLNNTGYKLTDLYVDSVDQTGNYRFDRIFSPRIAISHLITDNIALRALASHGFSPPTFSETLTPEGQINVNIQPETGWNYEIGTRGNTLGDKLFFNVSTFIMDIRNLLVAERTGPDTYIGVNAGRTMHSGVESNLHYKIYESEGSGLQLLRFFTTYTYSNYKFKEFTHNGNDYAGNNLPGTSPHLFNAGIDFSLQFKPIRTGWKPQFFEGNINYMASGKMPMNDGNTAYSEAYGITNIKLAYRNTLFKNFHLKVYTGLNNVLDEHYASMILVNARGFGGSAPRYYYPGLPRNFYGGLALKFDFK